MRVPKLIQQFTVPQFDENFCWWFWDIMWSFCFLPAR